MSDEQILTVNYGEFRMAPVEVTHATGTKDWYAKISVFGSATFSLFSKLAIVLFLVAILVAVWQEVFRKPVVLESIGIPIKMEEMGFSREVAAQHLWDAVIGINDQVETVKGHTYFVSQIRQLEVTEPSTGLSVSGLANLMRSVLKIPQKRVSGEFICGDVACSLERVQLRVRVFDGEKINIAHLGPFSDVEIGMELDAYFHAAGIEVLRLVDPYVLSIFLRKNGNSEEAIAIAESLIASSHKEQKKWGRFSLGNLLSDRGRYEDAIVNFQKAIELDSDFIAAYVNLGGVFAEVNRFEEASDSYQRAIVLDPETADAHHNLGVALNALGRSEDAIDSYNRAIKLAPKDAETHSNLADTFRKIGRIEEAIVSFQYAIELDPSLVITHNNFGLALAELDRVQEAVISYRKAIALDNSYVAAHSNLGIVLDEQGHHEEAIESYQRAIALEPNNAILYSNLAVALRSIGLHEKAVLKFQKAIELDVGFANAYYNLGLVLTDLGHYEEAIPAFSRANDIGVEGVNVLQNWGDALSHAVGGDPIDCEQLNELYPRFQAKVSSQNEETLLKPFDEKLTACEKSLH